MLRPLFEIPEELSCCWICWGPAYHVSVSILTQYIFHNPRELHRCAEFLGLNYYLLRVADFEVCCTVPARVRFHPEYSYVRAARHCVDDRTRLVHAISFL